MIPSFIDLHPLQFFLYTGLLTATCAVVYNRLYIRWLWRTTLRTELRRELRILQLTGGSQTELPEEN